ncbi:MAG: TetR/AcrR family transcriptional regulator [Candidatus Thiodiazotropha sp.]
MTGRRERNHQELINRLAETAWTLFEAQGFDQVTMEAVAAAADVAKATLYKHFPVKEALLQHHFHRQLDAEQGGILSRLEQLPTTRERLHAFFALSAEWSEEHRVYLPHYLHFRMSSAGAGQRSGTDRIFSWIIEAGLQNRDLRQTLPPQEAVHYLSFLYLGVLLRWLNTPGLSLADEFERMLNIYLDGTENRA